MLGYAKWHLASDEVTPLVSKRPSTFIKVLDVILEGSNRL